MRKLLFIHGWSDSAEAFNTMIHEVLQGGHHARYTICLADFISLDDAVTFVDLVEAMQAAWIAHRLPLEGKSVSVITHSTGALVLRAWLRRYYPHGGSPISHALLLAPPNFGSYLAHKGRAVYGRVLKGLGNPKPFEVGEKLLLDLELASPFLWDLANFDVCGRSTSFQPADILTTVAIGNRGYQGIASAVNIPGSDGVVSLACAQLTAQRLTVRYEGDRPVMIETPSSAQVALAIIPDVDHTSILGTPHPTAAVVRTCIDALSVQPADFSAYCRRLAQENVQWLEQDSALCFQQMICRVTNQYEQTVEAYYIDCRDDRLEETVCSVHTHSQASAYRSFTMQVSTEYRMSSLHIGITGMPSLQKPDVCVGYQPYTVMNGLALSLSAETTQSMFTPGSVVLLDWQIKRCYKHKLFQLNESQQVCTV